ncbi:DUF1905 domain-containing protein [Tannerella forsythia]|nr:DUF1905 domain-containing protein [Tannerella forsythia]
MLERIEMRNATKDAMFFEAEIYQTGINECVDVPTEITEKMVTEKGRIKIKGKINGFAFQTTLMPVKNANHRLFVNQAMMRGGKTALEERAKFEIEQDTEHAVGILLLLIGPTGCKKDVIAPEVTVEKELQNEDSTSSGHSNSPEVTIIKNCPK